MFSRYIGIDYSGQGLPTRGTAKLAACEAVCNSDPVVVPAKGTGGETWSRKAIAKWLVSELQGECEPTVVGIDHGFSFPIDYFKRYEIPENNWCRFLDDFQKHWPTNDQGVTVRSEYIKQVKRMIGCETGAYRFGAPDWFRLTDPVKPRQAASVFDFLAGPREVARSAHAGIPWLRYVRRKLRKANAKVHLWPFDSWNVRVGWSAIVEVYPGHWNNPYKSDADKQGLSNDERDAYTAARWMSEQDQKGSLRQFFNPDCFQPPLSETERRRAKTEGWILGVTKSRSDERG